MVLLIRTPRIMPLLTIEHGSRFLACMAGGVRRFLERSPGHCWFVYVNTCDNLCTVSPQGGFYLWFRGTAGKPFQSTSNHIHSILKESKHFPFPSRVSMGLFRGWYIYPPCRFIRAIFVDEDQRRQVHNTLALVGISPMLRIETS